MKPDIEELVRAALENHNREELTPAEEAELLRAGVDQLQRPIDFTIGDIVRWKPGMANRRYPGKENVAIVVSIIEPIDSDNSPSETYATEKYDCVLGVMEGGETFLTFYGVTKRFEKAGDL